MTLFIFAALIYLSIFMAVYQIFYSREPAQTSLPTELLDLQAEVKPNPGRSFLAAFVPLTKRFEKYPFASLRRSLVTAGNILTLPEFFAFKFLTTIILSIVGYIFFSKQIYYVFAIGLFGYIFPDMWLNQKIKNRQRQIARDLPNVIDLLKLCVGGGLDFMLAVNRVARDFKDCPLKDELYELWRETQMGKTRKDALKNLSWRLNMAEISSFVRTLIQADRMGSPIGEALRIQSEEIRIRRFQRGEEMALKAPIKLLFPLIVFILPVVLVIVGGPIILQFMSSGGIKF